MANTKEENTELIHEILDHPKMKELLKYRAHGKTSLYRHSVNVAKTSYGLCKKLNLDVDYNTLIQGALLHDFYLYDWHEYKAQGGVSKLHGFTHAKRAKNNAVKYFNIDKEVQDIIVSHMWPLNLKSKPASKEALVVCLVDKYCALKETLGIKG